MYNCRDCAKETTCNSDMRNMYEGCNSSFVPKPNAEPTVGAWKVYSNLINGEKKYIVGRVKDVSKVEHSGNVENSGGYESDRSVAQQRADALNGGAA